MQSSSKKLAIITRTHNRPLFLQRAIESVKAQTSKDFVHVIVNDAGDEKEIEQTVAACAGNDYETKVVHINTNGKMEEASNVGVNSVNSEYIAVHDDDDTWHPECAARAIEWLEQSSNPGVVVRTNKIVEKLNEANSTIDTIKETVWMPHMRAINLYRQCIENQMTPVTFIYKRSVYNELKGYDESLPVMGDWDFGIRFLLQYDVDFLDPGFALANYHHRKYKKSAQGNTSYAGNDTKTTIGNYLMNKYLREELKSGKLGVGYIMSKTKYEQNFIVSTMSRILPGRLKKQFTERFRKI